LAWLRPPLRFLTLGNLRGSQFFWGKFGPPLSLGEIGLEHWFGSGISIHFLVVRNYSIPFLFPNKLPKFFPFLFLFKKRFINNQEKVANLLVGPELPFPFNHSPPLT